MNSVVTSAAADFAPPSAHAFFSSRFGKYNPVLVLSNTKCSCVILNLKIPQKEQWNFISYKKCIKVLKGQ